MQLAGGKLISALVGTAIIGGGVTGGAMALSDKKDDAKSTTTPSPVASVSPFPSTQPSAQATAIENQASNQTQESENDQIIAAARVYTQALFAGKQNADSQPKFSLAKVQGSFAEVGASDGFGGFYILLKKGSGGWVAFASGNGSLDPTIAEDWGVPKSFFPWE